MISEYLNRNYVLRELHTQRGRLELLLADFDSGVTLAAKVLKRHRISRPQLARALAALDWSLRQAEADLHPDEGAFIPSDPLLCAHQTTWTQQAVKGNQVIPSHRPVRGARTRMAAAAASNDPSPEYKLAPRAAQPTARRPGVRRVSNGGFIENDDVHYGVDGFFAKAGTLFSSPRKFNPQPARTALSERPLRLYVFGDWGTGLPLARKVQASVRAQLDAADGSRQQHVVHLGDVYYVGMDNEYQDRILPHWPVQKDEANAIGSWSLNGNHDMYSGGYGYFDTLLRDSRFRAWQRDSKGKPSSFFLIEDPNWQVFGLDSSWNLPSMGDVIFSRHVFPSPKQRIGPARLIRVLFFHFNCSHTFRR